MPKKKTEQSKIDEPQIKKLIEISLLAQETNLTLTRSVNELSKRMDRFVAMFEEAAKNVGNLKAVSRDEVEEITKQIKDVVQQNRDLAEGLLSLDKYVRRDRPLR